MLQIKIETKREQDFFEFVHRNLHDRKVIVSIIKEIYSRIEGNIPNPLPNQIDFPEKDRLEDFGFWLKRKLLSSLAEEEIFECFTKNSLGCNNTSFLFEDNSEVTMSKINFATCLAKGVRSSTTLSGICGISLSDGDYSRAAANGNSSFSMSVGMHSFSGSIGDSCTSKSIGMYSRSSAVGNFTNSTASGELCQSAAIGDYSTSTAIGDNSNSSCSGDFCISTSFGCSSRSASSGNGSTSLSSGNGSISMVAGLDGSAGAGENGVFALPWLDENKKLHIIVGVVGENGIKPGVLYIVKNGSLVERNLQQRIPQKNIDERQNP